MKETLNKYFDICIIGGGAAGLVAGIMAARENPSLSVVIVEKMEEPGKKVAAAGNGRCNLSNTSSPDWERTASFFSSIGLLTRIDDEGKVYPYSEDGRDVVGCLVREVLKLGAEIMPRRQVANIDQSEGKDGVKEFKVKTVYNKPKAYQTHESDRDIIITAKTVLIATGGKSKPKMGTSGDGFAFARRMGHSINKLIPVLTSVETVEDMKELDLSGVREKCVVSLYKNDELVFSDRGEVQFTDYGISGIVVFDMSRFMNLDDDTQFSDYRIEIDFMPETSYETIIKMIEDRSDDGNLLCSWVKNPLANVIIDNSSSVESIADGLKYFKLQPKNLRGWDMAQVTRGGIPLSEIDESTGESNIVSGLYFAGEILDEDFKCGGFNLQHAWTTGMRAGKAMGESTGVKVE